MKIINQHSHLNGLEFLQVHHQQQLDQIKAVIESVDANKYKTKVSKEKKRKGQLLYDPALLNKAFKEEFRKYDWNEHRQTYYATPDEQLARKIMLLKPEKQKQSIIEANKIPYRRSNQTDFMKAKIAVEVQFGKYPFVAYDMFVKHMAFYTANEINVGIEIIPSNDMLKDMSSGPANYEGEIFNLYRQGRNTPAVPMWVIAVEA